ncbi:MAG: T9SS type A sorting domain-containing protein [Ignavibacteria bacterium]|nr:T9SS type A sorting domain-containing protein [Ignavibacteria bacterium]
MFRIIFILLIISANIQPQNWIDKRYQNGNDLFGVAFLDSLKGFAVGDSGLILQTIDGGEVWFPRDDFSFSGSLINLQKIDSSTLYALGRSFSGESYFITSIDFGESWNLKQFTFLNTYLTDINFINRDTGWVCGLYGKIFRTIDRMESWEEISDQNYTFPLRRVYFSDVDNGWVLGGKIDMIGFIRRTSDGGLTWRNLVMTVEPLYDIYWMNEDTVFVAGGDPEFGGWVYISSDRGETWRLQNVPPGTITLARINFVNPELGWASGSGSIIQTIDKGETWTTAIEANESILSIFSYNKKDFWFAGTNGFLICYKDTSNLDTIPNSIYRFNEIDKQASVELSTYPNPFNNSLKLSFNLWKNSFVRIELYDILGAKVQTIFENEMFEGNNVLHVTLLDCSSGVYFIVLTTLDAISTKKIFLIK